MGSDDGELYVYALAARGLAPRLRMHGRTLHVLPIGPADVVVERRRSAPELSAESLQQQHAIVVDLAERVDALLPARFGSSLPEAALRSTIESRAAEIDAALAHVRNRAQMTIRVFGEPIASAAADGPPTTGTAFLEMRRRAHASPPEVAVIRTAIGDRADDERIEPGARGVRVTVFHLVARDRVADYRVAASRLPSLLAPHHVTVSGPWPPFAFAPELF